jgi:uncharacterized protein
MTISNFLSNAPKRFNHFRYKGWLLFGIIGIVIWLLFSFLLLSMSSGMIFKNHLSYNEIRPAGYSLEFVTDQNDQDIDMWYFDNPNTDDIVLYLHGNAGRTPHFFETMGDNYDVLAPSYTGFGLSEGSPSVNGTYQTALLAYQWLKDTGYDDSNIIVFGHSLGGSAAIYLASKEQAIQKLVLVNTFDSMQSMCFNSYYIFCVFAGNIFNSAKYATSVTAPVRQFHYQNDNVVPYKNGQKLFTYFTATDDKEFVTLDKHTHSYFDLKVVLVD